MKKKGQAAMEFLMTYGWAILVVLIAIGALVYFGVTRPERFMPEKCTLSTGSGLFCEEFTASSGEDEVTLRIRNVNIDNAFVYSIEIDDPACTYTNAEGTQISSDAHTDFTLGDCTLESGQSIKGTITLSFDVGSTAGDGLTRTTSGQLSMIVP